MPYAVDGRARVRVALSGCGQCRAAEENNRREANALIMPAVE
jgi:hypothetical protein